MAEEQTPMAFITEYLKRKPAASYGEISKEAEAAGHKIYPIMYGRAKSLLGLIPAGGGSRSRRRRSKKAEAGSSRKLRQGRSPKLSETAVTELSGWVERFRDMEEERNRYRAALLSVEKILKEALEE